LTDTENFCGLGLRQFLETYYCFFTFIGSLQHSKPTSSQPQTVSTDTTIPQTSQEYFVPFLLAAFAAGCFGAGFVVALTGGFFVAGFFVAICVLLAFLCEAAMSILNV
jgi:hypothetical protein